MKTFLVRNGDLALGDGGFALISGPSKLRQDLALALQEPIGTDRFHRAFGSTLDQYVGQPTNPAIEAFIGAEVERVVINYITTQQALLQRDQLTGRSPRYDSGEVISRLDDVFVEQQFDRYVVTVTVTTMSREQVAVATSVEV